MGATLEKYLLDQSGTPPRILPVGDGFPRVEFVRDPRTGLYLRLLRLESGSTNTAWPSCDFTNVGRWVRTYLQGITDNGADSPFGPSTADGMIGVAGTNIHSIHQVLAETNAIRYVYSAYVKRGDVNWVYLRQWTDSRYAYFDLLNGEVGTTAICTAGMRYCNFEDWWRIWISYLAASTGDKDCYIAGATADNVATYLGDGSSVDYWVAGAQHEGVLLYPTSQIITVTGQVARPADNAVVWQIAPTANREFTKLVPVVIPEHTPAADIKLFSVYKDGAAATDHITAWADTAGKYKLTSAATGESAGSLVVDKVISDGNLHWLSIHAKHGELHGIVDTNHHAVDKDTGIAPDLDRFGIEPSGASTGRVHTVRKFMTRQPRPPDGGAIWLPSGTGRMWENRIINIDGTEIAPCVWLDNLGIQSDSLRWVCRATDKMFTQTGTGNDTIVLNAPYGDRGFKGLNGKYLVAPDGDTGNTNTKDQIGVIIGTFLGTSRVSRKRDPVGPNYGWDIYPSGGALVCALDGPGGTATVTAPAHGTEWSMQTFWFDRDEASTNGAGFYMNTTMGSGANLSAAAGNIDNSTAMWVGSQAWDHTIALIAIYSADDLFPGGAANKTEMDAVVAQLYNAWIGDL